MARDTQGYPCEPRNLADWAWFYEQKPGVTFCVCVNHAGTHTVNIPWSKLERAVDNHRALKAKKRKRTG